MKKLLFILIPVISSTYLLAQHNYDDQSVIYSNGGKVGIGTTSPNNSLHVKGTGNLSTIRIEETGTENAALWMVNPGQSYLFFIDNDNGDLFRIGDGVSYFVTINTSGNTGIGTEAVGKFDVGGLTYLRGAPTHTTLSEQLRIGRLDSDIRYHSIYSHHSGSPSTNYLQFRIHTGNSSDLTEQISAMTLTGSGNVGIGVTNPGSKLVVNGKIRSEEVKVEAVHPPDYVFEPGYKLRTLEETKDFITENKHLPEIPSASEMEAYGIDLGDMNMRLLKKIEELTLYIIEQNERLEGLETVKSEMDELRKELQELKNTDK